MTKSTHKSFAGTTSVTSLLLSNLFMASTPIAVIGIRLVTGMSAPAAAATNTIPGIGIPVRKNSGGPNYRAHPVISDANGGVLLTGLLPDDYEVAPGNSYVQVASNGGRPLRAGSEQQAPAGQVKPVSTPRVIVTPNQPKTVRSAVMEAAPSQKPLTADELEVLPTLQSANHVSCVGGAQNLTILPNHSGRGNGRKVVGLCLQVVNKTTGAVIWEGLTPPVDQSVNFRRLPYKGGGLTVRSKQPGLLGAVKLDDKISAYGPSYVAMAQLQAGLFGDVYYDVAAAGIRGEISTSLYDPSTDTHTFSPKTLPSGCAPWTEMPPPNQATGGFAAGNPQAELANIMFGAFFDPFSATLTAPPSGSVLGFNYVKTSNGRCWLGGAGSAVSGLPVAFSWGATLPLNAAYEFRNGQLVDVEEADSAALESAMLAFGFNPGQSPLKYSGNAITDSSGNFAIPYTVEKVGVGAVSVLRRGYRLSSIHKIQSGFRLWQRINPTSAKKPNKTGECLIGSAIVGSDGTSLDITYGFKGSSC